MSNFSRRDVFKLAGAGAASIFIPTLAMADEKGKDALFTLGKLPYAVDALEPSIDAETMTIHHTKHHQAYVDNLNKALAGTDWVGKPITSIITSLDKLPEKIRNAVRNNGGGHYNHTLFWSMMAPKGGAPSAALLKDIEATFKDVEGLQKALKEAAMTRFGSGWSWLIVDKEGKLKVVSSPNQDNPIMDGTGTPIMGIDVWEHAYYVKYRNKRADYVDAFFKVANWEYASTLYAAAKKG